MAEERKNIIIRVPQEFGRKLKAKCAEDGITQQEYIISLIEKDLAKAEKNKKD